MADATSTAPAVPPPASGATPPPGPGPGRRRRTLLWAALTLAVAVGVAFAWAAHRAGGYFEYTPGDAPQVTTATTCALRGSSGTLTLPGGSPCARVVVPPGRGAPIDGRLLMVDVLVGRPTPQDVLLDELGLLGTVHRGAQLLPAAEVLGSTPASQMACQDAQQMTDATRSAAVAALTRLGQKVGTTRLGARVVQVEPGSGAAAGGVRCNDLVTAIDGHPVGDAAEVAAAVHASAPGQEVSLTVQRPDGKGGATTLTLHARLGSVPARPATPEAPAAPAQPHTAFLGVATSDDVRYDLPFPVSAEVGDIGGPSAGLALTLGMLDTLSGGHLIGGHVVAATGTIAPDGAVGDVGGVAQKAIAVSRAGAQVFFVPPQEYAAALSHAGHMRVVAVRSLGQALAVLEQMGGALPPTAGTATA
ncbi:MAG TPA: PDZ domain-containing protein [Acidimicrobiales bacterium]|nr:PDZ domain-containing protein [Acidimicrobiales bacterium]